MLEKQGNMTQTEKSLNRGQLKDFKVAEIRPNAMIPGIFNESPLRNSVIPPMVRQAIHERHRANGTSLEDLRQEMQAV